MGKKSAIKVFNYTDYRSFLKDYFNEQKRLQRKFSYRRFAMLAGYNSSGLLKDVITGRSNIQSMVIFKFSRAIGLRKRESAFFENLVHFNQARTVLEKNHYFENMMGYLAQDAHRLHAGQYEFYSNWYYTAIRDLLSIFDFKDDYKALGRQLVPSITQQEAKHAIYILVKHKFIKRDKAGFYRAAQQSIAIGPEVSSLNVANFQRAMMDLAKDAILRFPAKERNISTLTFSVSEEAMEEVKAELEASKTRIRGIIERCKGKDRICQLNIQMFPLSKRKGNPE